MGTPMPRQQCQCGARFKFSESSLGKKAECKKCGAIFTLTGDDDLGPIPVAGEPDAFSAVVTHWSADRTPPVPVPPGPPAPRGSPAALGSGTSFPSMPESSSITRRNYAGDAIWTFLFPAVSPNNLVVFLIIWAGMSLIPLVLAHAWPLGAIGALILFAWYTAFRFAVLESAAAGENDLPEVPVLRDPGEALLAPLIKWIGSWGIVFIPALAYLISLAVNGDSSWTDALVSLGGGLTELWQGATGEHVGFVVLSCAGIAMWPMVVLCVAIEGFRAVLRVDLIALTIARTFPRYVLTLILMFGAVLLLNVLGTGAAVAGVRSAPGGGGLGGSIIVPILGTGLRVYLDIVLMRLVGLYYHHSKGRFAFAWE